jgi:molybdopterin-guanine dinucleotide biosynthesis protein A
LVVGAVLAGGQSRRMGVDKARLAVSGVPLAERVATALREAGCAEVVLVRRGAPDGMPWRFPVVRESEQRPRHVLTGFLTALEAAEGPVLVAACDLMGLRAEQARHLLEVPGGVGATSEGPTVLTHLVPADQASLADAVAASRGFRAWAAGRPLVPVGNLRNVNRWEDLGLEHPIARMARCLGLHGSALERAERGERTRLAQRGCLLP